MWPILSSTGIAPPTVRGPEDDDRMLEEAGVGFTDVGTGHPGTNRWIVCNSCLYSLLVTSTCSLQ